MTIQNCYKQIKTKAPKYRELIEKILILLITLNLLLLENRCVFPHKPARPEKIIQRLSPRLTGLWCLNKITQVPYNQ